MQSGEIGRITSAWAIASAGTQICHGAYSLIISFIFFIVGQILFWPHLFWDFNIGLAFTKTDQFFDYGACNTKGSLLGSLFVFSLFCGLAVIFDILHIFCGFCEPITFIAGKLIRRSDGRSFSRPFEAGCTGCGEFIKILILTGQFIFLILASIYTISPLACIIRIDTFYIICKLYVIVAWIAFIIQIILVIGCSCCVSSGEEIMIKRAIQKKNENKG